jgi:hypothetical protein
VTAQAPQFSPGQQEAALVVIEQAAWGDMDGAICDTETALRLALDATRAEYLGWEEELGPAFEQEGIGEFLVPAARVEEMSDADKLAYVARLLRTLALSYGVDAGFGYLVPGESPLERYDRLESAYRSSPAGLLHGSSTSAGCPPPRTRGGRRDGQDLRLLRQGDRLAAGRDLPRDRGLGNDRRPDDADVEATRQLRLPKLCRRALRRVRGRRGRGESCGLQLTLNYRSAHRQGC